MTRPMLPPELFVSHADRDHIAFVEKVRGTPNFMWVHWHQDQEKLYRTAIDAQMHVRSGALAFIIEAAKKAQTADPAKGIATVSDRLVSRPIESGDAVVKELEESVAEIAIEMPPGTRMTALAGLLFSGKTMELVFESIVADYQHEMFEAIKAGHPQARVRQIRTRHWIGFLLAVACQIAGGIGKLVRALRGAG